MFSNTNTEKKNNGTENYLIKRENFILEGFFNHPVVCASKEKLKIYLFKHRYRFGNFIFNFLKNSE